MDWNKTNSILIVTFIVVNIFLFTYVFFDNSLFNQYNSDEKEEFLNNVKKVLTQKNIIIDCVVPTKAYEAPFLDIQYDIIYPSQELIDSYIGKYEGEIADDILFYQSNEESIEIIGSKKIVYTNKIVDGEQDKQIKDANSVDNIINDFCNKKGLVSEGFIKSSEISADGYSIIKYVKTHNGINLENAYMLFYLKNKNVAKFEMQNIISINERAKVKPITAAEALLRLMTFDSINNREVKDIQICYYTMENKDFELINSINVDLVWKAVLDDNTEIYLTAEDY